MVGRSAARCLNRAVLGRNEYRSPGGFGNHATCQVGGVVDGFSRSTASAVTLYAKAAKGWLPGSLKPTGHLKCSLEASISAFVTKTSTAVQLLAPSELYSPRMPLMQSGSVELDAQEVGAVNDVLQATLTQGMAVTRAAGSSGVNLSKGLPLKFAPG